MFLVMSQELLHYEKAFLLQSYLTTQIENRQSFNIGQYSKLVVFLQNYVNESKHFSGLNRDSAHTQPKPVCFMSCESYNVC